MDRPVVNTPPPYSQRPEPTQPPVMQAPVNVMHASVGVMHTPIGVMHAPIGVVGMVGTNVGMVGTNVGMVGTNVGIVSTNVGMVGTNVGMGYGTTVMPMMVTQQMSPRPVIMTCKSCHAEITTRVDRRPTWRTHFFAGLLCLIG